MYSEKYPSPAKNPSPANDYRGTSKSSKREGVVKEAPTMIHRNRAIFSGKQRLRYDIIV